MSNEATATANRLASHEDFRLGEWLVQPGLCRLERGDSSVRLRPQLMDLLVCLATQGGKTVTREEIFARVWPGQYVVETALARCIAELRQVLEDDAHAPRVIETIPKRGYRLLLPVTAAPSLPSPPPASVAAAPLPAADSDRALPPLPGGLLPRRRRWALVSGVLCLPFVVGAVWNLAARTPAVERSGVVVAFTNATGESVFDGTLGLALAIQLEQSPYLRPFSAERVAEALRAAGQSATQQPTPAAARDACRRLGGTVLLTGSISALGPRYVIGLEAITCGTADVLAREQAEVEGRENVLGAVGSVAAGMRRRLGESLSSMAKHEVAPAPSALASLKAVSLGDAARAQGRELEAVRKYEEALVADPASALAHVRLGVVLGEAGRMRESAEHVARAYALRDRVGEPERFYIDAHYHARVLGDVGKAVSLFEEWQRAYPGSDIPAVDLARLYAMLGRYEDALQAGREALRRTPGHVPLLDLLGSVQMALGRFDEAAADAEARVARGTDSPALHRQLFEAGFVTNDAGRMAREVAWAEAHPEALPLLRELQADVAAFGGRRREATTGWAAIAGSMKGTGDGAGLAHHLLGQAYAEALWGDVPRARTLIASAVEAQRAPAVMLGGARVLTLARDLGSARHLLDACGAACGRDRSSLPQEVRAALALADRDARQALALLPPASAAELGLGSHFTTVWLRAEALRQAGRASDAAAEYRRIVDHRGLFASSVLYPAAHLGLARALAASRDWETAGQVYRRLLTIWKDADSDLPSLRTARAELAALPRS